MFGAVITDEFILGLDVLQAYDASVDLWCQVVCVSRELSLRIPKARTLSSRLALASEKLIPTRCEWAVTARQAALKSANGLVEPSLKTSHQDGLHIARILGRA
jgi:hypothetical protein